jgi:putative redox protein
MTDEISAHVAETGASRFAVRIDVGGHAIIGDEPAATGGADLGPSPFQLLAAALGECTAMTVRWYAERQKWPVDHVAVDVTHRKEIVEGRDGKTDVFRKAVHIHGPALSAEQREKLIEIAAKCPVQRTLEAGSIIRTEAASEDS